MGDPKSAVTVFVPGKLILTGEHSVVYGEPALIAAIDLWTRVRVWETHDLRLRFWSKQLGDGKEETKDSLVDFWRKAREAWRNSEKEESLEKLRRDPFVVIRSALAEALEQVGEVGHGFRMEVDSKIPVGCGLGSSASVSAAVIGAVTRLYGRRWRLRRVNGAVYETEKIMHGNPSGGDNTTVVYGGILRFRKIGGRFLFRRIKPAKGFQPVTFLVNSGRPVETTGEMVGWVNAKFKMQKSKVKNIIRKMGEVSKAFISGYCNGEFKVDLIRENERLLEGLGVVGRRAKAIIRDIEEAGGVAKVCGAGGVREGSGILLVYHEDSEKLSHFFNKKGWVARSVRLGAERLRWMR